MGCKLLYLQSFSMRIQIDSFDRKFNEIHERSLLLLSMTDKADLYKRPRELPMSFAMFSVGEYLLRSAAAIEQTFGGITTKLWDDPFEWTLPEKLTTTELVIDYVNESDSTRRRGMSFLDDDSALLKQIPAPSEIKPIFELLLGTVSRAEHFQGRAFAVFQMLSNEKLPRI